MFEIDILVQNYMHIRILIKYFLTKPTNETKNLFCNIVIRYFTETFVKTLHSGPYQAPRAAFLRTHTVKHQITR